jgi:hypothetical protein
MLNKKPDRRNGDYWLAKCALLWAENDIASARETFKTGQAYMAKLPNTGIYSFDRDCYSRMEAILNCLPPAEAFGQTNERHDTQQLSLAPFPSTGD